MTRFFSFVFVVVMVFAVHVVPVFAGEAEDWFKKGKTFYEKGQYKEAIEAYSKAIEHNPTYTDVYNYRGFAYDDLGDYARAIEDYNKAIELNPNEAVYFNRGSTYGHLGDYKSALKDYSNALEIDPNFEDAYNNRGYAYYILGDNKRAIEDYNKALEIEPKNELAAKNKARAEAQIANNDTVKTPIDKAALAVLQKWEANDYGRKMSWHVHEENGDGIASTGGVSVKYSAGSKTHAILGVELPGTLTQEIASAAKSKGLKFSGNTVTAFVVWLGKFSNAHIDGMVIGKTYADKVYTADRSAMSAAVTLAAAAANDDLDGLGPLLQAYSASRKN